MPDVRPVFVTGTDTGIGKSFVTGGICRLAHAEGLRVGVMKPVETGCDPDPEDALFLAEQAGNPDPLEDVCIYRFAPPISPETAARQAGVQIEFERITTALKRVRREKDLVLVEGAGGLLVPLDERRKMADLAAEIGGRVLLVVGSRLGMINHALLTISETRRRGLELVGIVINQVVPSSSGDRSLETNVEDLGRHTDERIFGALPYVSGRPLEFGTYTALMRENLDARALLEALRGNRTESG